MRENLEKYFTGELTPQEKEDFLREAASDPLLKEEFIETQNLIGLTDLSCKEGDFDLAQSSLFQFKQQIKNKKIKQYIVDVFKYAAVIAIVAFSSWFISKQYYLGPIEASYTEIEVPQGQRTYVRLDDGTTVWLNSRSKLRYPNSFTGDKRVVILDGDAFFSVQKNDEKPFIVKTSRYDVQVLGTKFKVFNYSESPVFETTLLEGSVKVFKDNDEKNGVKLEPDEKVVMKNGLLEKRKLDGQDISLLKSGYTVFDNEPFENIIRKLQLYYDVKFVIRNEGALQNVYTGNFSLNDPISEVLNAIQNVQKFNYTMSSDRKIIYIN